MAKKNNQLNEVRYVEPISVKNFIDNYFVRIDLDADYQREKVWTLTDQETLLDSILRDIDIPKIYLVEVKNNKQFDYECIDGKQRMITLLEFFDPNLIKSGNQNRPLCVEIAGKKYTYAQLKMHFEVIAKKIEDYELTFVIYRDEIDYELIKLIFRRLQLGVRLNSGELLKTYFGTIRDFVYKDIGNQGPFLRNTKLSESRFSRPFTLAQICINSFKRHETGEFGRARLDDIKDFFEDNSSLEKDNDNLVRIKKVLEIMDKKFGEKAESISSRAVAVSSYLFVEYLYTKKKTTQVADFVKFYIELLEKIKFNNDLLSKELTNPENRIIMERFQKYISQASVEARSIQRRHDFLEEAFKYYLNSKPKGKIIGEK